MGANQPARVTLKTLPLVLAVKAVVLLGCGYLAKASGVSMALVASALGAAFLAWNLPSFARRSNRTRIAAYVALLLAFVAVAGLFFVRQYIAPIKINQLHILILFIPFLILASKAKRSRKKRLDGNTK